ncbi:MAG: universal stress protein [Chitinophaga sp.]|uniref:universal stress protein n=1 Tax=Chitinophaga sp. TaxID=1869181 RepID=UPI0025C3A5D9|nr:universal stress protein [Chitinophaga sp.]MBV8255584.1 universal stress protein [Chitinophaga sp.]
MQRITAVFDSLKLSDSTLHYALMIAKKQEAQLIGVMPDDPAYDSYSIYQLYKAGAGENTLLEMEQADRNTRMAAMFRVEKSCQERGIPCKIHNEKNYSLTAVLEESIYTDLMIIDEKETFCRYDMSVPSHFIRDLLSDVQCPVLLVPHDVTASPLFPEIDKVVILYDGGPSSMYAVKVFNYLFPAFHELPIVVLSVNQWDKPIGAAKLVKEYINDYFPNAEHKIISGHPEEKIVGYLELQEKGTMVVLGAYSRSRVSRWFHESMADILLDNLSIPILVAHNK